MNPPILKLHRNIKIFVEFAGGLACSFASIATAESYLSLVNAARNESKMLLQDMALVVVLQYKK